MKRALIIPTLTPRWRSDLGGWESVDQWSTAAHLEPEEQSPTWPPEPSPCPERGSHGAVRWRTTICSLRNAETRAGRALTHLMGINYLPLSTAAGLFLAGVLIYPALFLLLRRLWAHTTLGKRIRDKYAFTDREVADISNKIVSAFQAVMAGVSGIIIVHACLNDVLREKNPMSVIYGWFGIPYFVYDTFCMFYVYRLEQMKNKTLLTQFFNFVCRNPVIVTHHIIMAPIGFTLILFYRDEVKCGDFFVGILYMMEVSTPFVSLRFILSKMKLKGSILYTVNGFFMLLTFPVFRIASVLWATYLYTSQNSQSYLTGMLEVPALWLALLAASLAPQIYWFVLMTRGLVQILRKQPLKEE